MTASNTFNVRLRVLKENKSKYDTFSVREVPFMESVSSYKDYFYRKCKYQLSPAIDDSFAMGYYGEHNQTFTIQSAVQLAEALSLIKKDWLTIWIDPFSCIRIKTSTKVPKGIVQYSS